MVAFILSHTSRNKIKAISNADRKSTLMKLEHLDIPTPNTEMESFVLTAKFRVSGEEDKINKEENPLSPADWIVFLSGEISDHRTRFLTYLSISFAVMLAFLAGIIIREWLASLILVAYIIIIVFLVIWYTQHVNKEIKSLKRIRDQILCGDLKEYDEIYKEYKRVK